MQTPVVVPVGWQKVGPQQEPTMLGLQAPPTGAQSTHVPATVNDVALQNAVDAKTFSVAQQMSPTAAPHASPSAAHGALWQRPLAQTFVQHSLSVVHAVPTCTQPHFWTCLPLLLVKVNGPPLAALIAAQLLSLFATGFLGRALLATGDTGFGANALMLAPGQRGQPPPAPPHQPIHRPASAETVRLRAAGSCSVKQSRI